METLRIIKNELELFFRNDLELFFFNKKDLTYKMTGAST